VSSALTHVRSAGVAGPRRDMRHQGLFGILSRTIIGKPWGLRRFVVGEWVLVIDTPKSAAGEPAGLFVDNLLP